MSSVFSRNDSIFYFKKKNEYSLHTWAFHFSIVMNILFLFYLHYHLVYIGVLLLAVLIHWFKKQFISQSKLKTIFNIKFCLLAVVIILYHLIFRENDKEYYGNSKSIEVKKGMLLTTLFKYLNFGLKWLVLDYLMKKD